MKNIFIFAVCIFLSSCNTAQKKVPEPKSNPESPPKLLTPNIKKIWIAPVIKDGGLEWEEGHYLYRIERTTQWSR